MALRFSPGKAGLVALAYFAFYTYFTGIIDYQWVAGYAVAGFYLKPVTITSSTYTGPGLQLIASSLLVTIRLLPLALAAVLSALFGFNIALIWTLYKIGGSKLCLKPGSGGGLAAFLANLAPFSYICCGWAGSLILVGGTFLAAFSNLIAGAAIGLLALNGYVLSKRLQLVGGVEHIAHRERRLGRP
jgi:hypothetical protein